jgi:hypothetical protein
MWKKIPGHIFGPWRKVYVREFKKYPGDPQSQEDCQFVTPLVKDAYIEGRDAYISKVANPHHLESVKSKEWNRGFYDAKIATENLIKGDFAEQLANLEHQLDNKIDDYENAAHRVARLEHAIEQLLPWLDKAQEQRIFENCAVPNGAAYALFEARKLLKI